MSYLTAAQRGAEDLTTKVGGYVASAARGAQEAVSGAMEAVKAYIPAVERGAKKGIAEGLPGLTSGKPAPATFKDALKAGIKDRAASLEQQFSKENIPETVAGMRGGGAKKAVEQLAPKLVKALGLAAVAAAGPAINERVGEIVDEAVAEDPTRPQVAEAAEQETPVEQPAPVSRGTYQDPARGVDFADDDVKELRKILYSEIGNRSQDKRMLEARVLINTALNRLAENRSRGRGPQTLAGVLKEKNQYQGYGTKQYQIAANGQGDPKKLEAIDSVIAELQQGALTDNTNGAFYYIHNDDGTITYDDARPLYK